MNFYIVTAAVAMALAGGFWSSHYLLEVDSERPIAEAHYGDMVEQMKTTWRLGDAAPQ